MNTYKDRGIIKWSPFDGLQGFNSLFADLKYQLGMQEKPILYEDKLNEMNRNLKLSLSDNIEVKITWYKDGYLKTIIGYVSHYSEIDRCIIVNQTKYRLDDIIDLVLY